MAFRRPPADLCRLQWRFSNRNEPTVSGAGSNRIRSLWPLEVRKKVSTAVDGGGGGGLEGILCGSLARRRFRTRGVYRVRLRTICMPTPLFRTLVAPRSPSCFLAPFFFYYYYFVFFTAGREKHSSRVGIALPGPR